MILIIAEKPSLGRNIAAGIAHKSGNAPQTKRNGYIEAGNYLVSWAFGHLFSLADIEEYSGEKPAAGEKRRWTLEGLPCFPEQFRFEIRHDRGEGVDPGVARQVEVLRTLMNRPDVDTVVNAGDADREGEIIVRLCVSHLLLPENRPGKRLARLWLPDQTPETVAAALEELKDETEYDHLADEGFARTYIDWLYGVNLTRYATVRTGAFLRVGRVIVPIVQAIYDRDMAIRNFVPGKYFAVSSKEKTGDEEIELTSKARFDENRQGEAEALCRKYNEADAVVTKVTRKKDRLNPGKLYSLSKLQSVLGKKYKMTPADSLAIVQKLYEEGYLTYPRTNSEYLATAEKDKMKQILANIRKIGYPVAFKDSKNIFDDSKIEAHSAITPTYKVPAKSQLSDREMQVYSTVFRRFVAVFCAEECVAEKTEITVNVGGYEDFVLKGTVILEPGWTKYDDRTGKDRFLPKLEKGDLVNHNFRPIAKETTPPKHYNGETLLGYLKNPFREDKNLDADALSDAMDALGVDDAAEYKAIFDGVELGTEATRAGIIENACRSKYIQLKNDVYTILPDGEFLIESLARLHIVMDKYKTSNMGRALKRVYRGELAIGESVRLAEDEISEVFAGAPGENGEDSDIGNFLDPVGTCPLCGKEVVRGRYNYGCAGYKDGCRFRIPLSLCGKTIPLSAARALLTDGKTAPMTGFWSKKKNKPFDASLKLEDGQVVFSFDNLPRGGTGDGTAGSELREKPAGYMTYDPSLGIPPDAPLPEPPPPRVR